MVKLYVLTWLCLVVPSLAALDRALPSDVVEPLAPAPEVDFGECSATCGGGYRTRVVDGQTERIKCATYPCLTAKQLEERDCQIDLVFVLDRSGSINPFWSAVKSFATDIVNALPIGPTKVRVGMITYSSSATVNWNLNTHGTAAAVTGAIAALPSPGGGTNTAAALELLNTRYTPLLGGRAGVPNVAIVLTDGYSNNPSLTAAKAAIAKGAPNNIKIYAVGIGSANPTELNAIGSGPDYVHQVTAADLPQIVNHLTEHACAQSQKLECCSVCGDPHYHTFDKEWIHYQGPCKYDVASHRYGQFRVHGKNTYLGGSTSVSYLKYFDVYYGSTINRIRLGGPGLTAYYCNPSCSPLSLPATVGGVSVALVGGKLVATLSNGVKVTYGSSYCGKVCVPEKYLKLMQGICGNYDLNMANDLLTSYNFLVPDNFYGHQVLGNSWQVPDPEDKECCSKTGKMTPPRRCRFLHPVCQLITTKPYFSACAKAVNLQEAYNACQMDICNAQPGDGKGMQLAACNSINNLQDMCADAGITISNKPWAETCGLRTVISVIDRIRSLPLGRQ